MSHQTQTLDFGVLIELQRQLLHGMGHRAKGPTAATTAAAAAVAAAAATTHPHVPSALEQTVGALLRMYPQAFSSAVVAWRSALQTRALNLLEHGIDNPDGAAAGPNELTLEHPRLLPLDAQTLQEALPFLHFHEREQGEEGRGDIRRAERAIRAAFASAVERMHNILAETHLPHPKRARLIEEAESLMDRAHTAGCGGGSATLQGCLRAFPEEDVLHERATDLLERLRAAPVDPRTERAMTRMVSVAQKAEGEAMPAAAKADNALTRMGSHSGERAVSVLLALRLGAGNN
jgi:hypothetical protein